MLSPFAWKAIFLSTAWIAVAAGYDDVRILRTRPTDEQQTTCQRDTDSAHGMIQNAAFVSQDSSCFAVGYYRNNPTSDTHWRACLAAGLVHVETFFPRNRGFSTLYRCCDPCAIAEAILLEDDNCVVTTPGSDCNDEYSNDEEGFGVTIDDSKYCCVKPTSRR